MLTKESNENSSEVFVRMLVIFFVIVVSIVEMPTFFSFFSYSEKATPYWEILQGYFMLLLFGILFIVYHLIILIVSYFIARHITSKGFKVAIAVFVIFTVFNTAWALFFQTSFYANLPCGKKVLNERNLCFSALAYKEKNAEICRQNGGNAESQRPCVVNVTVENAIASGDNSLCSKLSSVPIIYDNASEKDKCFEALAIRTRNFKLCDEIVNARVKQWCKDSY
jgi:hypothetical protein